MIEDLGGVAYAYARSADVAPIIIEQKNARNIREDAMLTTGFDPERAFLFDPETGARLR